MQNAGKRVIVRGTLLSDSVYNNRQHQNQLLKTIVKTRSTSVFRNITRMGRPSNPLALQSTIFHGEKDSAIHGMHQNGTSKKWLSFATSPQPVMNGDSQQKPSISSSIKDKAIVLGIFKDLDKIFY